MSAEQRSPALALIYHLMENCFDGLHGSRERWDRMMWDVLRLCVANSVPWDDEDLSDRRIWPHVQGDHGEWLYAIACGSGRLAGSRSFIRAFETLKKRKAFTIADPREKTRKRIYVGREFWWEGRRVGCTSFARDQQSLIAVERKWVDHESGIGHYTKIVRRFRITHAALAAYHRKIREGAGS